MSSDLHKTYDGNFKLKVALAAIKNDRPMEDLSKEFDVAISQIYAWKKQLEEQGHLVFADKRKPENQNVSNEKKLQATIEKVTAERDFLVRVLSH